MYGPAVVYVVLIAWLSVPVVQLRLPQPRRRPHRRRERLKTTKHHRPAYVYRFVDRHGRRGYIGKTVNLRRRLREHGFDPDHVEVVRLPSEQAALAVEEAGIRADAAAGQPLVNYVHNRRR